MKIKDAVVYNGLRVAKRKYRNYFSTQGLLTRRLYHFFAKFDPLVNSRARKDIYYSLIKAAKPFILHTVNELKTKGYAFVDLKDLEIETNDVMNYCQNLIDEFKLKQDNNEYLETLYQAKYSGRTIAYHIYQNENGTDPFVKLAMHDALITIATLYIEYLPMLEEVSLLYNPVHSGKQFGSQLWHRDSHYKKILKIFFSPVEIKKENGPFEFFPANLSHPQYYKDLPEGMTDERLEACGLDLNCAISFLAKPSQYLLVDTERCLHRGGLTQQSRYIGMISYGSPLYSFSRKKYRQTGAYELSFKSFKRENETLIERFSV